MRSTERHEGIVGVVALHGGRVAMWTGGASEPCGNCEFYGDCSHEPRRRVAWNLCMSRSWTAGVFHRAKAVEIMDILERTGV